MLATHELPLLARVTWGSTVAAWFSALLTHTATSLPFPMKPCREGRGSRGSREVTWLTRVTWPSLDLGPFLTETSCSSLRLSGTPLGNSNCAIFIGLPTCPELIHNLCGHTDPASPSFRAPPLWTDLACGRDLEDVFHAFSSATFPVSPLRREGPGRRLGSAVTDAYLFLGS